jgi:hypothetical protein
MKRNFGAFFELLHLGAGTARLVLVAALGFVSQANAALFTFSTGQVSENYGTSGYTGDTITLEATSDSTVDLSPGLNKLQLNVLVFDAELSDPAPTQYAVKPLQSMTMTSVSSGGTATGVLEQTGTLAISTADVLSLSAGDSVTLNYAGVGSVIVTPLALDTDPNGGGAVDYDQYATFDFTPVPEPINYALAGFGLIFVVVSASRFHLGHRRSTAPC